MELAACVICESENGTNGWNLIGFSENVDFSHHFMASHLNPTLPPSISANGIGYANTKTV